MSNEVATVCPNCSTPVLVIDRFCEACGEQLVEETADDSGDCAEIDAGVAAGVTHRGLLHRRNEDALHLDVVDGTVVAVVCDGVSSSVAADAAARIAASTAGRVLGAALAAAHDVDVDVEGATRAAIAAAQDAVVELPWVPARALASPACTMVTAVWDGATITVCGIGDSRAYWIGAASSDRLTVDDSWAQEMVDAGLMSERAAEADPRSHAITRWLGTDAPDDPYPVRSFVPDGPGRLVVCSDGLWNYAATAPELAELVAASAAPPDAAPLVVARALVDAAIAAGGHDNITVVVVDVSKSAAASPMEGNAP